MLGMAEKVSGQQETAGKSLGSMHGRRNAVMNSIEAELEFELDRETHVPPEKSIARLRQKGEHVLHSKQVLLLIVALNLLDCILVLGELILDIHFIVDLLEKSDDVSSKFWTNLEVKYPESLSDVQNIGQLYSTILQATILWTYGGEKAESFENFTNSSHINGISKRDVSTLTKFDPKFQVHHNDSSLDRQPRTHDVTYHGHTLEEDIAHGFHKASITILAILAVETLVKFICTGRVMLKRKLELFDGFVVIASFSLDLIFIKGLTQYPIQKYVFILAFLVPWRVIRVVNSLLVAVIDHEHFRMKLIYSQKKNVCNQLKKSNEHIKDLQKEIQYLKNLGQSAGIPEWSLNRYDGKPCSPQRSLHSLAMFTFDAVSVTSRGEIKNTARDLQKLVNTGNADKPMNSLTIDCNNEQNTGSKSLLPSGAVQGCLKEKETADDNTQVLCQSPTCDIVLHLDASGAETEETEKLLLGKGGESGSCS